MGPNAELIACPNSCANGAVDTGGMTPWGQPISGVCPRCGGRGVIARRDYEEELASIARSRRQANEDKKSVLS